MSPPIDTAEPTGPTVPARARSHWGWGYTDQHLDRAARIGLGQQLERYFGLKPREPAEAVPLDAIRQRASRLAVPSTLADLLSDDAEDRARHAYGRAFPDLFRGFQGDFEASPDLVAHPRTEDDLKRLMDHARAEHMALVPYGGGTSVVGGVEGGGAPRPAISVDLGHFNRVLEVDDISRLAKVQAGLLGPALEAGLAPHGLTLRHFPQSFEFSTVGGWLATRAGGHFATRYTHIDDLTAGLRMLTPAHGVWESRCLPGSGAGPSPDRLALGSEGTFGFITEAWLRVRPKPRWRASFSSHFKQFDDAVAACRALAQSGLEPANCRLLDAREAALNGVAFDGSHVLLVGFESADHPQEFAVSRARAIAEAHAGVLPEPPVLRDAGEAGRAKSAEAWRGSFLQGPYLQGALLSLGLLADTFETACTWRDFPALHAGVIAAVRDALKQFCGGGRISCRFTHVYADGPAPYYTWIGHGKPGGELEQWGAVKSAASDAILAHGGTITHHHAVGRLHVPWYGRQRPHPFGEAMRAIKRSLDPERVMNPGVLGLR
jgi:alkyldihydroxyacetonephosphate synthase